MPRNDNRDQDNSDPLGPTPGKIEDPPKNSRAVRSASRSFVEYFSTPKSHKQVHMTGGLNCAMKNRDFV